MFCFMTIYIILFFILFYVFELEKLEIFDLLFQKGLMDTKKKKKKKLCYKLHNSMIIVASVRFQIR